MLPVRVFSHLSASYSLSILRLFLKMTGFDPRQPITDPSVFSPRGMYVDNRSANKGTQGDDDDDVKAFVFNASDMKALNRFLGTGRKLQTTRSEYLRWLGISDTPGEISAALGTELESLLKTYTSVCILFSSCCLRHPTCVFKFLARSALETNKKTRSKATVRSSRM